MRGAWLDLGTNRTTRRGPPLSASRDRDALCTDRAGLVGENCFLLPLAFVLRGSRREVPAAAAARGEYRTGSQDQEGCAGEPYVPHGRTCMTVNSPPLARQLGYTADTTKVHDEVSSDRTVSWTVDYYKSI